MTMSITISELLKLPSLQGARVVAGEQGLGRWISTISVLEYVHLDQFKDIYYDYYGSEMLISAFYSMRDNVDLQCTAIEALNSKESAGLILFYVGAVLPYVDERLIALCNRVGFPIIVMPENRLDLRYGEVIYEAMEAILKSQFVGADLTNAVIEQTSRMPVHQRSVSTVMRILSDKTHSTILLADASGAALNVSVWPRNMTVEHYLQEGKVLYGATHIELHGESYQVVSCPVRRSGGPPLQAVIYKRGEPLTPGVSRQVGETIQIAVNLWETQGENLLSELVGAIVKDEPYKVQRIARLFGVRIEAISNMWMVTPRGGGLDALAKLLPALVSEELSHLCGTVVFDVLDDSVVVLTDNPKNGVSLAGAAQSFRAALESHGIDAVITVFKNLESTTQVRRAYLLCRENLATALEIYPHKRIITVSEIRFAHRCRKIVESGESAIAQHSEVLDTISKNDGIPYPEMLRTLSTYYLDAQQSAVLGGEMLYLHKNTIQYRIRKYREATADGAELLPDLIELYTALAIHRILDGSRESG